MKLLVVLASLFFSLLLYTCGGTPKVLTLNGIAFYQSLGEAGAVAEEQMNDLGVGTILLVNGAYIHSEDGMSFAPEKLGPYLEKVMPDKQDRRIIVLDWEGERMNQILRGANQKTVDYVDAKKQFLAALKFVKSMRPRAIVGFYGFPERNYWKREKDWKNRNTALLDFLSETDALFPSLYDFYVTTDENKEDEIAYARENAEEFLRIGLELGKPVYPFIWHRYHDSNKQVGKELIPFEEVEEHVKTIASVRHAGKKVDGIVWWSSERYFYNISRIENKSQVDFDERIGTSSSEYLRVILKALENE